MRHTPLTFAREKERMGEAGRVAEGWGWGRGKRETERERERPEGRERQREGLGEGRGRVGKADFFGNQS